MNTGEKIVKARQLLKLTQDQLATKMEVTRQTISKWELGESLPETNRLIMLSQVLEVSIDYLLDENITERNGKMKMKKENGSIQPDWTTLYPILEQYKKEVDIAYYEKIILKLIKEIENKYNYSFEDAMLVTKELLASSYFKELKK